MELPRDRSYVWKLALALLEGKFARGDTIVADVEGGRIIFAKDVEGETV